MRWKTIGGHLLGCCVIVMVACVTIGGPAFAKEPQPKATVSPSKNLTNNETVTVSGSNFVPGSQVYITECTKDVKGKSGLNGEPYCSIYNTVLVTVTSAGGLPPDITFTVGTGVVGLNGSSCGTSKVDKTCYVGVGDAQGDNDDDALAKITFAVPK